MNRLTLTDVREIVAGLLSHEKAPATLREEDTLSALGLDSLAVLNVIISAGERFGIDLSRLDEGMPMPDTFADLLTLLNGEAAP